MHLFMYTKLSISEVVVAPPFIYLTYVRDKLPATLGVAAQNCYKAEKGAFTGEVRYNFLYISMCICRPV